jgi:uncharacterized protein
MAGATVMITPQLTASGVQGLRAGAGLAATFILIAALALVTSQAAAQDTATPSLPTTTLTVDGRAEVSVDPDRAVVRLGVNAEGADAAAAQDQVNRTMAAILEAMQGLAIPERSIRTEQLWLNPVYSSGRPRPDGTQDEPRIIGYRAGNVISIQLDELERIGNVIDAGIRAGANQLQGVTFTVRDREAARNAALQDATRNARAQADAIAEAMSMRIVGVHDIIVGGADVRPVAVMQDMRMESLAATPVRPGQVDVAAGVTVTYRLSPL